MEPGGHQQRQRLLTYPGLKQQQAGSSQNGGSNPLEQRSKSNNLNNGNESPESGSLYSDEIPSGYNSGEQYDTISCGYMSGEAYELPDTRMELREPDLEVIEECLQPLGSADSDENIFRMPTVNRGTPEVNQSTFIHMEQDEVDLSSTSSGGEDKAGEADSILNTANSPPIYGKKHRKKPLTFSIPIETSPLCKNSGDNDENEIYDNESSDAGMGDAPTGGYRAVPSDTDTSAVDSDPNAMAGRHKRLGGRKTKKYFKNHDEAWFMAHDTKTWSTVRIILFWFSILSMVAACILASVLIFLMPKNCDPDVDWFQGKVILDILGPNDLNDLEVYKDSGIAILHLKLDTKGKALSSTKDHIGLGIEEFGGSEGNITRFFELVHQTNLTIIVQVPVIKNQESGSAAKIDLDLQHSIDDAIHFWMKCGADGIFLDGLETFEANIWILQQIGSWHSLLQRYGNTDKSPRILMTSYKFAKQLSDTIPGEEADQALKYINLLDAHLDFGDIMQVKNSSKELEETLEDITQWDTIQSRPWINWNLDHFDVINNAGLAFQLLLPGTINLGAYPGTGLGSRVKDLINLRALAVPIYMNGNYKRCDDCHEKGTSKEVNYAIHQPVANTIQLERFYSRRHRYVLVANFGEDAANLSPVGSIYSGGELVLDTSKYAADDKEDGGEFVKFSSIDLLPGEAIVIKLPK